MNWKPTSTLSVFAKILLSNGPKGQCWLPINPLFMVKVAICNRNWLWEFVCKDTIYTLDIRKKLDKH